MAKQDKKKDQEAKTMEKALRVGLGLLSLGGEKVSDLMDDLAKRGSKYAGRTDSAVAKMAAVINEKSKVLKAKGGEASEWVTKHGGEASEWVAKHGAEASDWVFKHGSVASEWVAKEVKLVMKRLDFVTREEFSTLQAEVEALKKKAKKKPAAKKKTTKKAATK